MIEPDSVEFPKKLAELKLGEGKPTEAARFAEMALHVDVEDVDAHRLLADASLGAQRYDTAIEEYQVAIDLKPEEGLDTLQLGLARAYAQGGRPDEARALLQAFLRDHPGNADARQLLESLK
jgi:predicted Zn-dependent protease